MELEYSRGMCTYYLVVWTVPYELVKCCNCRGVIFHTANVLQCATIEEATLHQYFNSLNTGLKILRPQ